MPKMGYETKINNLQGAPGNKFSALARRNTMNTTHKCCTRTHAERTDSQHEKSLSQRCQPHTSNAPRANTPQLNLACTYQCKSHEKSSERMARYSATGSNCQNACTMPGETLVLGYRESLLTLCGYLPPLSFSCRRTFSYQKKTVYTCV